MVDYYHKKVHKEMDSVVAHVRQDCWVVKCRKIAAGLDGKCAWMESALSVGKRENNYPHR